MVYNRLRFEGMASAAFCFVSQNYCWQS